MVTASHCHAFFILLCCLFSRIVCASDTTWKPQFSAQEDATLEALVTKSCPEIATVGYLRTADGNQRTKRGNRLQVITIGYHPTKHQLGVAEVRLTANIHGNEVAGRFVLQQFVKMVCLLWYQKRTSYHSFIRFFQYLAKTRIHILMSANPDGYDTFVEGYRRNASALNVLYLLGRNNANNRDLNRNFFVDPILQRADQDSKLRYPTEKMFQPPTRTSWKQEIETQMIQHWMASVDFLLAASLHGGQRLATVPFDGPDITGAEQQSSPSSQIDVSLDIAKVYMQRFQYMGCGYSDDPQLDQGVVNGAAWYPFIGSMGDYSYLMTNCLEVTIEMYCAKYPRPNLLNNFKSAVLRQIFSVMDFLLTSHWGIKGRVMSPKERKAIPHALIFTMDLLKASKFAQKPTVTSSHGEYFRLLQNGRHVILVAKRGYAQQLMCVDIQNNQLTSSSVQEAQILNFALRKTRILKARFLSGCQPNEMTKILSAYHHWSVHQWLNSF